MVPFCPVVDPAAQIPSVEEAKRRLLYRQQHGDSALAFSFMHPVAMAPQPEIDPPDEHHIPMPLNYDGRIFALRSRKKVTE
jgi:hypothetical protein